MRLVDGTSDHGWLDIADLLDIPPGAKRQLDFLDEVASDHLGCKGDDVVRFIEWLQRNPSASRASACLFVKQLGRTPVPLD